MDESSSLLARGVLRRGCSSAIFWQQIKDTALLCHFYLVAELDTAEGHSLWDYCTWVLYVI
jgi:hypothetical protein